MAADRDGPRETAPGFLTAVGAMAAMAARSRRNRLARAVAGLMRRKGGAGPGPRRAGTPSRRLAGLFVVVFGLLFLLNSLSVASLLAENLSVASGASVIAAESGQSRSMGRFLGKEFRQGRLWPDPSLLPPEALRPGLRAAFGGVLGLALCACLLLDFGDPTRNPRRQGATMEWLLSFPARPWSVFAAEGLRRTFQNVLTLNLFFPALVMGLALFGYGRGAFVPAVVLTLAANAALAGIGVAGEVLLRQGLSRQAFLNLRSACLIAGMLLLSGLMVLAIGETPRWFASLCAEAAWPALLFPAGGGASPAGAAWLGLWPAMASGLGAGLAVLVLGAAGAALLTRRGLEGVADRAPSGRGAALWKANDRRRSPFFALAAKEALLLGRDRLYLTTIVVLPLIVAGFPLAMLPEALSAVRQSAAHAAALAFSLGALSFLSSAYAVLNVEQRALWLLYGLPFDPAGLMLRKTAFWALAGLVYPAAALAAFLPGTPDPPAVKLGYGLLALGGTVLYAFVAGALGVMATDPTGEETLRRQRLAMSQLYTLLGGLYLYAVYAPGAVKLLGPLLAAFAAWALWQKVRQAAPGFLDPEPAPRPPVDAADAAAAAMAWWALSGASRRAAQALGLDPVVAGAAAAIVAGAAVVGVFVLVKRRVFSRAARAREKTFAGPSWLQATLLGALAAAPAGLAARFLPGALFQAPVSLANWRLGLATVVLVPALAETVFRGVVQNGLRRSLPPLWAGAAGALLSASGGLLVGAAPLLIAGAASAWVMERSGSLGRCLALHAAFVLVLGLLGPPR